MLRTPFALCGNRIRDVLCGRIYGYVGDEEELRQIMGGYVMGYRILHHDIMGSTGALENKRQGTLVT